MKHPMLRGTTLCVLLALALFAVGCSKKAQEQPPTPPPAPPQETPTNTPTPTPPQETPPTPVPSRVSSSDFRPAFFDLDSYALRDDAREALDHDGRLLRDNSDVRVTIEGHCDERGTVEYNQSLGERRAQAARDYLVAAGIDASRLQTLSYGKERPFDQGHDEAAWAKNRRAHLVMQ
jgi:peptidoglycan-associated lipoprotein